MCLVCLMVKSVCSSHEMFTIFFPPSSFVFTVNVWLSQMNESVFA